MDHEYDSIIEVQNQLLKVTSQLWMLWINHWIYELIVNVMNQSWKLWMNHKNYVSVIKFCLALCTSESFISALNAHS